MSKHSKTNASSKKKSKVSKSKTKSSNVRKTQEAQQSEDDKLLTNSICENIVESTNSSQKKDTSDNGLPKLDVNSDAQKKAAGSDPSTKLTENENSEESSLSNNKDPPCNKETEVIRLSTSDDYCTITSELPAKREATELFNSVHSGQVTPTLPNRSWSIHCTEAPDRCIVISEMVIHNESGVGLVPLCIKQIVFDEKMNYELFLINSRIVIKNRPCIVQTIADVMHVIAYTHNLRVCMGGPEVISYGNVNLECAYKDPRNRWRHNLCTLEVTDHNVCESCASLDEVLQKQVQRNRPQTKRKRVV